MELNLKNKLFIVTGATAGLGNGVAVNLIKEEAKIIAVARNTENLENLRMQYPEQVETVAGDITDPVTYLKVLEVLSDRYLNGVLVNSGGPPAKAFLETTPDDWDKAYQTLLRWKVVFTLELLKVFRKQQYGRLVYIESSAVKQPVSNLVLSNSVRMAVVGFVKTLSQEIANEGITLNVLAPGFHETAAAERLFVKKSEVEGITIDAAKQQYTSEISVGKMGDPHEFGMLATWLLSEYSGYITGQTISVDGGNIKGMMG
ncbi:MAG: SDR family oxidoreductase [Bacteroidales bacterium]|nr:SDR family oxidoreductase [Bacteroidales bacterium]